MTRLASEWPGSRLVEVWNSFAGVAPFTDLKPVKKFTNRKAAVARIWAAVQRLSPDSAGRAPDVAPAKGKARSPRPEGARRRAQKGAEERSNKKADVIAMMKRAKGVTLAEIVEVTGWRETPALRGSSAFLGSKGGLKVEFSKNAAGEYPSGEHRLTAFGGNIETMKAY